MEGVEEMSDDELDEYLDDTTFDDFDDLDIEFDEEDDLDISEVTPIQQKDSKR
jgi:hypothetical protein